MLVKLQNLCRAVWFRASLRRHRIQAVNIPSADSWTLPRMRGNIAIGRSCCFSSFRGRSSFESACGGRITIGDYCFVNGGCDFYAALSIEIGPHVMIGPNVVIYDTDFHAIEEGKATRCLAVTLEANVWIGASSIILPGVTIGAHSVVAAGSVVTNDVPPKTIVGGNPARILRSLECADDWVRH